MLNAGQCCQGSITLAAQGAAAEKWPRYVGEYTRTRDHHNGFPVYRYSTVQYSKLQYSTVQYNGFPVYRSSSGLFLYKHSKDKWRANSVVNERGVLRGTLSFLELGEV